MCLQGFSQPSAMCFVDKAFMLFPSQGSTIKQSPDNTHIEVGADLTVSNVEPNERGDLTASYR